MKTVFLSFFLFTALLATLLATAAVPLQAQGYRENNPNLKYFYMARQQVQIIDETPVVNYHGGGSGGKASQQLGGSPGGSLPLPKAGWQQYSSGMPNMQMSLPKVVNGVPAKETPPKPQAGKRGKADTLKPKAASKPIMPTTAKSYGSYQGYGGGQSVQASGSSSTRSTTNVKGSILHWNRSTRRSF